MSKSPLYLINIGYGLIQNYKIQISKLPPKQFFRVIGQRELLCPEYLKKTIADIKSITRSSKFSSDMYLEATFRLLYRIKCTLLQCSVGCVNRRQLLSLVPSTLTNSLNSIQQMMGKCESALTASLFNTT